MLGAYLLISLCFVFAALVEFAIVLLVKHKQDLGNNVDRAKHIKFKRKNSEAEGAIDEMGKARLPQGSKLRLKKIEVETIGQKKYRRNTVFDCFYALSLTTRIDFVAFLLFNFLYFLLNLIHWLQFP